jgi:hypothetical protein
MFGFRFKRQGRFASPAKDQPKISQGTSTCFIPQTMLLHQGTQAALNMLFHLLFYKHLEILCSLIRDALDILA